MGMKAGNKKRRRNPFKKSLDKLAVKLLWDAFSKK